MGLRVTRGVFAGSAALLLAGSIAMHAGVAAGRPALPVPRPPIAAAVLGELNAERAAHGLPALRPSSALEASALRHARAMARADAMSHRLPGEAPFTARIRAAGYPWRWAGENIAWNSALGTAGAVQLERIMYRERPPADEHRVNILDPHYRDVGVAVLLDPAHHRLWLTTDFGARGV